MNLASIARALGGEVTSGHVLAPGPSHSKQDRSLAVFLDPQSPDLFRVHSFCGDDWKTCRDFVKARLGLRDVPFNSQLRELPKIGTSDDDKVRTIRALKIWGEACNLEGTPGLTYFAKRGVDLGRLPPDLNRALRWHPQCPWGDGRHGAIIALFTDIITSDPKALHRIAVTPSGDKLNKRMLGPSAECVIRLWPDDAVTDGVVLGEGVETTLVAATRIEHRGTHLMPAWACGSAGTMAKFPILAGVEALTILVDNDESGAGQRAAAECSARWTAAGREVFRLIPNVTGGDFADIGKAA